MAQSCSSSKSFITLLSTLDKIFPFSLKRPSYLEINLNHTLSTERKKSSTFKNVKASQYSY